MAADLPELIVPHAAAWRSWLAQHHGEPHGVWLVLARKGTVTPTSLTYDQALDEALCHGWIDGQVGRRDEATYRQRFTPRRARSLWSLRNTEIVDRLVARGAMHPAGLAEVTRARADGRWDAAYAGSTRIGVPEDLTTALRLDPAAQAMFETLTRQNRYAVLYRIEAAKRPDTRARRIAQSVAMLARRDTPFPQRRSLPD